MPANPYKEERAARKGLDAVMRNQVLKGEKVNYLWLVRETSLNYSVSISMIKNFIEEYYVATGEVRIIDDELVRRTP